MAVRDHFKAMAVKLWGSAFEQYLMNAAARLYQFQSPFETPNAHNHRGMQDLRVIKKLLTGLGLPLPTDKSEFLDSTEGALIFLDDYAVVMRIELNNNFSKGARGRGKFAHIENHPNILQPLFKIETEHFSIGLYPGCEVNCDFEAPQKLGQQLEADNIKFWDSQDVNMGYIPYSQNGTTTEKIPVVIDVTAVNTLHKTLAEVREALDKKYQKTGRDQQALFYAPLRNAFATAWDEKTGRFDPEKAKDAWALCKQFKSEGKLVAGWTSDINLDLDMKARLAHRIGRAYQSKRTTRTSLFDKIGL